MIDRRRLAIGLGAMALGALISDDEIVVSSKSIEDFGRRLRGLTRGLWKGEIDKFGFVDSMSDAIERGFNQAWTEGARSCGIEPSERTPEEEAKLREMINGQLQYLPGLADYIMAHSKFWLEGGAIKPTEMPPSTEPTIPSEEPPSEDVIEITRPELPDIPKFKTVDEGMYWIEDNIGTRVNKMGGTRVTKNTLQNLAQELQEVEYRTGVSPRRIMFDSERFKNTNVLAQYDATYNSLFLRGNYFEKISMLEEAPSGWFADTTFRGNFWHEMAHVIDDQSGRTYARSLKQVADATDIRRISVYALSDWDDPFSDWKGAEGFAEAVSAYMTGKIDKLTPGILEVVKKVFIR